MSQRSRAIDQAYRRVPALLAAGRLQDAAQTCQQILAAAPNHADTMSLLAMTTPRTIQVQSSKAPTNRAWDQTGPQHTDLFTGLTLWLHGRGLTERFSGLKRMMAAARKLK